MAEYNITRVGLRVAVMSTVLLINIEMVYCESDKDSNDMQRDVLQNSVGTRYELASKCPIAGFCWRSTFNWFRRGVFKSFRPPIQKIAAFKETIDLPLCYVNRDLKRNLRIRLIANLRIRCLTHPLSDAPFYSLADSFRAFIMNEKRGSI